MGSPVSPIVVNLFMEHFERQALDSYTGTPPTHWYRYVDDTWVKIKVDQLVPFFDHIKGALDNIWNFTFGWISFIM